MLIKRLLDLDGLWDIQNKFEEKNNIKILNISNWNCSYEFKQELQNVFSKCNTDTAVEYIYSYNLPEKIFNELKLKYSFCNKKDLDIQITPNNTVSIIYVVNLIKQLGFKKICVVSPTYFSVYNAFDVFGINYDKVCIYRTNNQYQINQEINLIKYDVIWITYPLFCGGVYFDKEIINKLEELSENTLIITDESYCEYGKEMPNRVNLKNHIGIYSPHKAIGFNAFKFSLITFDKKYTDILEQWSDVLCGSLSTTNYEAILHFLSPNYYTCQNTYSNLIENARCNVFDILTKNNNLSFDKCARGNMMMIYADRIPYKELYREKFYQEFMASTMGCIIPGYLHDYNAGYGFSFRVNLSLYNDKFYHVFNNICNYLNLYL